MVHGDLGKVGKSSVVKGFIGLGVEGMNRVKEAIQYGRMGSHRAKTRPVALGRGVFRSNIILVSTRGERVAINEQSLFRSYTGTIPYLFLRYIDDCIGIVSCSHEELEQFIHFTNTFHPNLK
eukprot:g28647.t1